MTKTIYEMAVAYATEDGEGGKPIVVKIEKDAAIFGANYVVDEIEKCSSYDAFCQARKKEYISDEHLWELQQIRNKIKQLKGE